MKLKIFMGFLGLLILAAVAAPTLPTAANQLTVVELQARLEELQAVLAKLKQPTLPQLSSMSGPTQLKVGERGIWRLKAVNLPANTEISYKTGWGDDLSWWLMKVVAPGNGEQAIQSFHKFSKPGTYTQTFTISAPGFSPVSTTTRVKVSR